jgi:thiol-disulfide isomerase/thioredoxin
LNDPKQESLEKDFTSLPEVLKSSFVGSQIKEKINQINSLQLGSPFINFIQNDSNGKPLNLSRYLGNYILLEFWASWCVPCREQNPALVKVYQKFRDKKFKIIGIALEAPMAKKNWLKAIKDDQLEWDQVTDFSYWNNEVAKLYNVQQVPFNYLISPEGKIIGKNLKIFELEQKLNLYLSDLPPFVRP